MDSPDGTSAGFFFFSKKQAIHAGAYIHLDCGQRARPETGGLAPIGKILVMGDKEISAGKTNRSRFLFPRSRLFWIVHTQNGF
jgi:hypothetical protein